jgi:hypothetical protein
MLIHYRVYTNPTVLSIFCRNCRIFPAIACKYPEFAQTFTFDSGGNAKHRDLT